MTVITASDPVGSDASTDSASETSHGFEVRLDNFEGPFDLLLSLISKHKLDITEVSLSRVTDEFIAHVKAGAAVQGEGVWDLEQTSSFLVVAATLLDLKCARLLPQGRTVAPTVGTAERSRRRERWRAFVRDSSGL